MSHPPADAAASTETTSDGIMARLKETTWPLHQKAETRPLQQAMGRGTLPRNAHAAFLGQLLHVHATLEGRLRDSLETHPNIGDVFKPHHARENDLRADLEFYGVDADAVEPLDATREMIDRLNADAQADPLSLLGHLYVLDGSMNGNKFLARVIGKAYGLTDGLGLAYLDPYGDAQRETWQSFKNDMNAVGFDEESEARIIDAANAMFIGISAISDAVYTREVGVITEAVEPAAHPA